MLHVEGNILDDTLNFDVKTPERCHQIRKAIQFFDPDPSKSSCSNGCTGCPVPKNFKVNQIPLNGKEYVIK